MLRPCAYCKELGHHIRVCPVLEEKNRREQTDFVPKKQYQPAVHVKNAEPAKSKNPFDNLYSSSDDEIEEGEIVEFHSDSESSKSSTNSFNRRHSSYASIRRSDGDRFARESAFADYSQSGCRSTFTQNPVISTTHSENKWGRSGIKAVHVPIVESEKTPVLDDETYPEYVYEPSEIWLKYRGWSWVDIEYDSDN